MLCRCSQTKKQLKFQRCAVGNVTVYYELNESLAIPGDKYRVVHGVSMEEVRNKTRYLGLMMNSDRAWEEGEHGVRFIKNRVLDIKTAQVDMKEFMWVKLKAKEVK